ncbi:hypothetical protein CC1G_06012 [Coprinopsis cinerea okayama7|uniref:CBM1 domain-containing protein n=1 Tax=Coprinopsis cinerea (strain Okayama-7 / 130 / ATCC MYA-4618 / FGSC 9003) TaxID=240176 RepID=A8N4N4_COPC7|nr:hypothetical protein CC1G_06012 [Coprinopsis cinerea okayama7\|eukprot:XP_001829803.1 hypothetical protein CC1G_06012 [Coprinopsis cinerea okayama7\
MRFSTLAFIFASLVSTVAASPLKIAPPVLGVDQCGGDYYDGSRTCPEGLRCQRFTRLFHGCVPVQEEDPIMSILPHPAIPVEEPAFSILPHPAIPGPEEPTFSILPHP